MQHYILLLLALCQVHSTPESDALLDSMLLSEGLTLPPAVLAIRREIFEMSFLVQEEGDQLSLQSMYTKQELDGQNGAVLDDAVTVNEELQKRAGDRLAGLSTPKSYDSRKLKVPGSSEPLLNTAQDQMQCGNCYLHTFLAAVEIAYAKASGSKVKFSEQEMTDCYFKGCRGGDYRMVSVLMSYIDKISSRADYGDYLDKEFTCRQETTPDALEKVKVTGYVEVTPATVEAAVVYHGSVMTCMKWTNDKGAVCRMDNYKAGTVVNYPAVPGGCDHAVLIVGYTPTAYIVRNSHGKTWGDNGYFLIKRGTNSCGIENDMAAVTVEARADRKTLAPNKCPANTPKWCKDINTCIPASQTCVAPSLEAEVEVEEVEKREEEVVKKREEVKRYSRSLREEAGGEVAIEKRCADLHPQCPMLKAKYTCNHSATKKYCVKLCGLCGGGETDIIVVPSAKEKKGNCMRPAVANGQVKNKPVMRSGEKLIVSCNNGYILAGESVYCLIQNTFTNGDKDARLMPECVKLGSNKLTDNGASYMGTENQYRNALGQLKTCDFWKRDVLEGQLMNKKNGLDYQMGNHNYCRNPSGKAPVPMCLGFDGKLAKPFYCFNHPGCDSCAGAANSPGYSDSYCNTAARAGSCDYKDEDSRETVDFYWGKCKATCCAKFC